MVSEIGVLFNRNASIASTQMRVSGFLERGEFSAEPFLQ
jgi:hypothetical protein